MRIRLKKKTHPNAPTAVVRAVTEVMGIHMERGGGGREERERREGLAGPAAGTNIFRHDATWAEARNRRIIKQYTVGHRGGRVSDRNAEARKPWKQGQDQGVRGAMTAKNSRLYRGGRA